MIGFGGCFLDFNSHAHVERDVLALKELLLLAISTHTLTWSVTGTAKAVNTLLKISTHTLTWSVTSEHDPLDIGE